MTVMKNDSAEKFPYLWSCCIDDHPRTGPLREKDGLGPVMVSDTLCPAVHILGRLFFILEFMQGSGPEGDDVL